MSNTFEKKITAKMLLQFSLPSIIMMMFFSLYTIIDGMFVSIFVGSDALGAINIVYPIIALCLGISVMVASGGSAIIGKKLGEKKDIEAKSIFTFLIVVEIIIALIIMAVCLIFIDDLIRFLGATDKHMVYAKPYITIMLYFIPFSFLQNAFQVLFVTAGKPKFGLAVITIAGIANILFDYIFIVVLNMGILGAGLGTSLSWLIPSITGLCLFFFNRKGILSITKFKPNFKVLGKACINGSSEMVTNLANAVTTFLFNIVCLKYYQEAGVSAITIVLYFQFLITAIFFGYSQGIGPIISYKYGQKNYKELKSIFKTSIITCIIVGIICFGSSLGLIYPVAHLFSKDDVEVYNLVVNNYIYYSPGILVLGISIFASSFFTALNDGKVSAIISFLRTLVLLSAAIIVMPMLCQEIGIWIATPIAEVLALAVSCYFLVKKRKVYMY